MDKHKLVQFAQQWLAAWTGNQPQQLLAFYTDTAFYLDPAYPQGIEGKAALSVYFTKLLSRNPDWCWTVEEIFPTEKGFTLKWKATIPVRQQLIVLYGLDIVELEGKQIARNEVYFDRTAWLAALNPS